MPDNWSYVFAAYGIAAVALIAYWRHLARRAHQAALRRVSPAMSPAGAKRPRRRASSSTGTQSG